MDNETLQKPENELSWQEVVRLGIFPAPADLDKEDEDTEDGNNSKA
jgi:hypothetical protein